MRLRAIPPGFESIQANGCKNVRCDNFGIPPKPGPVLTGRGNASSDGYAIVNTGSSTLACRRCGKSSTLKSNKGIHEEQQRLAQGSLTPPQTLACPAPACGSADLRKFGKTRSGSARYQCKECRKTFAVGKPTRFQKMPHKNETVFGLIVNRMPIRRMCEVAEMSPTSLYGKIDFIYEQCLKFAADRERRLCDMEFGSRYLCTDRQDYMVNWGDTRP